MNTSDNKDSGFDVDAHADELTAIHPRGCEIARDLLSNKPYNWICRKRHVAPNTVAKVSAVVYKKPISKDLSRVQNLLGNVDESPDVVLVELLIEICRFMGSFSRTQAAIWIREQTRQIMQATTRYLEGRIDSNAVRDILAASRTAGYNEGLRKGAGDCAEQSHEQIRENADAAGYSRGFEAGQRSVAQQLNGTRAQEFGSSDWMQQMIEMDQKLDFFDRMHEIRRRFRRPDP